MPASKISQRALGVVKKSQAAARYGRRASGKNHGGYRRLLPRGFFLLLLVLAATVGLYTQGRGRVMQISDGDTITIFNQQASFEKIRLYGIDCPESDQPGGREATAFTDEQVFLEEVGLTPINQDRYGRTVGLVHLPDGRMLNEELIRNGHAWVYRDYCDEPWCVSWLMLEREARGKRLGLWAQNKPVPPWDWRKKKNRR